MSEESHLPELTDAARRAESIVNDQINSIVDVVQRQAQETRRNAEDDARATRHEAMESAQRVLDRIGALERPLGELVQTLREEMDRVGRELEGPVAVEATAIPAPPESPAAPESSEPPAGAATPSDGDSGAEVVEEPEPEQQPEPEPEPEPEQQPEPEPEQQAPSEPEQWETIPQSEPEQQAPSEPEQWETIPQSEPDREEEAPPRDEPVPVEAAPSDEANETATGDAPTVEPEPEPQPQPITHSPTDLEPEKKSGRFRFFRRDGRGKGAFITSQGHCAVCQKTFTAGSEENLRLSGWKVSGDVGLCPECQADGWQLPDGARLPFRRGGG